MTRVYAFTLVCDLYQWPSCHNAFARARAGALSDVLDGPEVEAQRLGWQTVRLLPGGRVLDVCPECARRREAEWLPWPEREEEAVP